MFPHPKPTADPSPAGLSGDSPALLIDQARMLVQAEQARFASAQSRATTLLAMSGVIAGLGGTLAVGIEDRAFPWPVHPLGATVSVALLAVILLAAVSVACLVWTGALALGAMQQRLGLNAGPASLTAMVGTQFPAMLASHTRESARAILSLLADQLEVAQEANEETDDALRRSAFRRSASIAAGVALSALTLAVSTPTHRAGVADEPNRAIPIRLDGAAELGYPDAR